jgi:hypothetical protein
MKTIIQTFVFVLLAASAMADIQVAPTEYDFGDVEVATPSTTIITVSNVPGEVTESLLIYGIYLEEGSSPDFEITVNPGSIYIPVGESEDIEITFTPSDEGYESATLVIASNDPFFLFIYVALSGTGVEDDSDGGDFEITWSTIDGGGGKSSGDGYMVIGTIGQPDAGEMAGGDYELSGGFWPRGPQLLLQCFVDFEHFAAFAMYWLDTPCNEGNNWCDGADLDYYGDVDLEDVKVLADWWLTDCPEDWPWE